MAVVFVLAGFALAPAQGGAPSRPAATRAKGAKTAAPPKASGRHRRRVLRRVSPRAFKRAKLRAIKRIASGLGALVGYAGLLGLRYPVKPYEARVSAVLGRGSRLNRKRMAELRAQGYRSVVSLTAESRRSQRLAREVGLAHTKISIIDNRTPSIEQMVDFLDFVTRPENQPAYVHCQMGKGRTSVAVAVYRMAVEGWPLGRALAEARAYGLKFRRQVKFLRAFDQKLSAGEIPGYPKATPARGRAEHRAF